MNEEWGIYDKFSPILIQNYIRFQTAAHHIHNQDNKVENVSATTRFHLSPEHYKSITEFETTAALLGLTLSYNENDQVLTAEPDQEFLTSLDNPIIREVAIKQSENCHIRYSNFIQTLED